MIRARRSHTVEQQCEVVRENESMFAGEKQKWRQEKEQEEEEESGRITVVVAAAAGMISVATFFCGTILS